MTPASSGIDDSRIADQGAELSGLRRGADGARLRAYDQRGVPAVPVDPRRQGSESANPAEVRGQDADHASDSAGEPRELEGDRLRGDRIPAAHVRGRRNRVRLVGVSAVQSIQGIPVLHRVSGALERCADAAGAAAVGSDGGVETADAVCGRRLHALCDGAGQDQLRARANFRGRCSAGKRSRSRTTLRRRGFYRRSRMCRRRPGRRASMWTGGRSGARSNSRGRRRGRSAYFSISLRLTRKRSAASGGCADCF